MKYTLAFLAFSSAFVACKPKSSDPLPEEKTVTKLEVTAKDSLGNVVSNVGVRLYDNLAEYNEWYQPNFSISYGDFTDANGKITLDVDASKTYYLRLEKDCKSNKYTSYQTQSLVSGTTNKWSIVLGEVGEINVYNATTSTYTLFVDGVQNVEVAPSSRKYITYLKKGTHLVKAVQKTGVSGTPIEKTFNVSLNCGDDKSVRIQ